MAIKRKYDNILDKLAHDLSNLSVNDIIYFGQMKRTPIFSIKKLKKGFLFKYINGSSVIEYAHDVQDAAERELRAFYRVPSNPLSRKLQKAIRKRYDEPQYYTVKDV